MTTFQLITLPLLAVLLSITAAAAARRRLGRGPATAWILLWIASAASIAHPDALVIVARILGIGRGADLVLYLSILFMFAGFFAVYLRLRRLESHITTIVRHLAIDEADTDTADERQ
ncbi:MAG TPA: DUF2304 domain-containing protein [Thermoanaerobaculia bacterium]|nr:DUF2304 domain-containing protein [Thermoanaerobaculia bacterium]